MKKALIFLTILSFALIINACASSDDDDDNDDNSTPISGVCIRDDGNGVFCIDYVNVPASNESAVGAGCENDWGGMWTLDGACPTDETLVGTCDLTGDADAGADSAMMEVYSPTATDTAQNDICGDSGTWTAAE